MQTDLNIDLDADIVITRTFREILFERVVQTAGESINGSPWADCVEDGLATLKATMKAVIDANPTLVEIFDRQAPSVNLGKPPF